MSERRIRQRDKEKGQNTVKNTAEIHTNEKIVPFDETNISQDNDKVKHVQNISLLKDGIENVQNISQDNIVNREAGKMSKRITRQRDRESERNTVKNTAEEHRNDKSVHFDKTLDEPDHFDDISVNNDVAEDVESISHSIDKV